MGGFIRGLIGGFLVSGIAFSAFAIAVPRTEDGPSLAAMVRESEAMDMAAMAAKPADVATTPVVAPVTQAEPIQVTSPGGGGGINIGASTLSSPTVAEGSGAGNLGGTTDSAPTQRVQPTTQVAAVVPITTQPTVNTETLAQPDVIDIGNDAGSSSDASSGIVELTAKPLVTGNALATNAAAHTDNANRPMMAIILQDAGAAEDLRRGLLTLSAPITFGVTANLSGASDISTGYHDKGYEVVVVMPDQGQLAERGMSSADMQSLLSGVFDAVPVATALVDRVGGEFPSDPNLVNAALETLKTTGHAFLTHRGNGLNSVPQKANSEGVPSDVVFRVIDETDDAASIRTALERAVLEASKSGKVIVIGRVRPDTVTTLFSWLLSPGASSVSIVPVSQVLAQ